MIEKVIFVATMILVLAIIFQEPIMYVFRFLKNKD